MPIPYTYVENLATALTVPPDGILSRTLYTRDGVKAVLFGFSPGQELSEHTAAMPAIIHIVSGQAHATVGGDGFDVGPGAVIHMEAQLPHSIVAQTPLIMLLLMLKGEV